MKISDKSYFGKSLKKNWLDEMKERQILLDNENIIAAIKGDIESPSLPLHGDRSNTRGIGLLEPIVHVRTGVLGLTNKRVLFYMPKWLNRYEFESYDLDQISSIQFTKGLVSGRIQITAFNDYKIVKWVDNTEGKQITTMIQKSINALKYKESENSDSEKNNKPIEDDAMKVLKLRYVKGEITKEEYRDMRKMIRDE